MNSAGHVSGSIGIREQPPARPVSESFGNDRSKVALGKHSQKIADLISSLCEDELNSKIRAPKPPWYLEGTCMVESRESTTISYKRRT